jgi:hypothetical protein
MFKMRKIKIILIVIALLVITASINFSCDPIKDECDGMGTLSIENKSLSTVQRLMIDGVNYGSVDPGNKKDTNLAPGTHSWQMVGISGGTGCSAATVIIVACQTSSFSCSAK